MRPLRRPQESPGANAARRLWLVLLVLGQVAVFGWPSFSADSVPSDEVTTEGTASEEEAAEELPAEVASGLEILTRLQDTIDRFAQLTDRADHADAEGKSVFEHQTVEAKREYLGLIDELVRALAEIEAAGLDGGAIRERLEGDLPRLGLQIAQHLDASEKELGKLRSRRGETEPADLLSLEQKIATELEWVQQLYEAYVNHLDHLGTVGLDASRVRDDATSRVASRADELAGRVELTNEALREVETRLTDDPKDADGLSKRRALDIRSKTLIAALSNLADQMDRLGLESASYRKLVIRTTGELTPEIFKTDVVVGLVAETIDQIRAWAAKSGPAFLFRLTIFLAVVVVAWLIAVLTRSVLHLIFNRRSLRTSKLLEDMTLAMVSRVIVAGGILLALSQIGVELGPILAGLGIAGFIVGFALQDALANFAAGVMILVYQPFDVDDLVEVGGVFGRVSHMSLVSTTILTLDNQTLIVPNGKIWGDVIKNVTHQKARRIDMEFCVSYANDADEVEKILTAVIDDEPRILRDRGVAIKLSELTSNGMLFVVRPWVSTDEFIDVKWDLTREIKRRFDDRGIRIAAAQYDVRVRETPQA